jgi:chloride channel protein, CIC family
VARSLTHALRRFTAGVRETEQTQMVFVAAMVGILGGLCAVGFRLFIRLVSDIAWHQGVYTLDYISGLPIWWKILAPSLGGLVVGFLVWRFAPEAKGHGVPVVMEAVAVRGGRLRPRLVVATTIASGITIGSGGSVGREGPIVQIGSALGSAVGQWLKMDARRMRTLVGCGAAAGIAATFNAPVAGALFAAELILGDFGVSQFSPIVVSSVAATTVSRHFLGAVPAFEIPAYSLASPYEFFIYVALGILAALVAVLFIRVVTLSEDLFERVRLPQPVITMIGGTIIGVTGIWLPHVYGVGYEVITEALRGNVVWQIMAVLVVAKVFAVAVTVGSGGSGGIFAPSLFIGAMLGGSVGAVAHSIFPAATADAGAYALVGMGAVVAGTTHAPLTAILVIFELTGDYEIILPLMVACILAALLATRLHPTSIYTVKLERRGIDLFGGRAVNLLRHVFVRDVMRPKAVTLAPDDSVITLLGKFVDHPGNTLFVTDRDGTLHGVVAAESIRPIMQDPTQFEGVLIVEDLCSPDAQPRASPDDSLANVMKTLGSYRGEIPVVDNNRLVGVVWPQDVIARYNTEVFMQDMTGSMVQATQPTHAMEWLPNVRGAAVAEVPVPTSFLGRSIGELDIRRVFSVSVLLVKHTDRQGRDSLTSIPTAQYRFKAGDVLLAVGSDDRLQAMRLGIPP